MCFRRMAQVFDLPDLDVYGFAVLMALANRANEDGVCWPGIDRIADDARIDVRTVRDRLTALEADGLVEITPRPGRSSLYRLRLPGEGARPCSPPAQMPPEPIRESTKESERESTPAQHLAPLSGQDHDEAEKAIAAHYEVSHAQEMGAWQRIKGTPRPPTLAAWETWCARANAYQAARQGVAPVTRTWRAAGCPGVKPAGAPSLWQRLRDMALTVWERSPNLPLPPRILALADSERERVLRGWFAGCGLPVPAV